MARPIQEDKVCLIKKNPKGFFIISSLSGLKRALNKSCSHGTRGKGLLWIFSAPPLRFIFGISCDQGGEPLQDYMWKNPYNCDHMSTHICPWVSKCSLVGGFVVENQAHIGVGFHVCLFFCCVVCVAGDLILVCDLPLYYLYCLYLCRHWWCSYGRLL